jgi:hypothetical protein
MVANQLASASIEYWLNLGPRLNGPHKGPTSASPTGKYAFNERKFKTGRQSRMARVGQNRLQHPQKTGAQTPSIGPMRLKCRDNLRAAETSRVRAY